LEHSLVLLTLVLLFAEPLFLVLVHKEDLRCIVLVDLIVQRHL
jgi:hypothetical protein